MKKVFISLFLLGLLINGFAQERSDEGQVKEQTKKGGFKKENFFTGGGLTVTFSNSTTVLGGSPVFGYSINRWIDAGIVVNFNYASDRHLTYYNYSSGLYYASDDKLRQTVFGPGIFCKGLPHKILICSGTG